MQYAISFLLILTAVFATGMITASAEPSSQSENTVLTQSIDDALELPTIHPTTVLWIPHTMIIGEQYHGVIITDAATAKGLHIFLSTEDNTRVKTPNSVLVQPHKNHASFQITPLHQGDAKIYAVIEGKLYDASTHILSPQSTPDSLGITLAANTTKTDTTLAYLTVYDQNKTPTPVSQNTVIHITAVGAISAPSEIIIKNTTSSTRFELKAQGTGSIIASADGLGSYRADIKRLRDEFTVHVAVAPDIAMPNSYVFYYVWIEKDGKPYRPPHVIDATINSENFEVGRFDENPQFKRFDGLQVHLTDGITKGVMYTGKPGHATVTVSVPGFGIAQDDLFVGSVRLDTSNVDTILEKKEDNKHSISIYQQNIINAKYRDTDDLTPNILMSWIYPPTTDGQAWMVVATYHIDEATALESQTPDNTGYMATSISRDTVLTPAASHDTQINISSSLGLEHDNTLIITSAIMKTNAVEIPILGTTHGSHEIFVSGQNLKKTAGVTLDVVPNHIDDLSLSMTRLPVIPNHRLEQDLAIISVLDKDKALIDVYNTLGRDTVFAVFVDDPAVRISRDKIKPVYSGSAIISGILLKNAAKISATLDGVGLTSHDGISVGYTDTSLDILAPDRVHVDESFPFVIHTINHAGIPLGHADGIRIFSQSAYVIKDNHMRIAAQGPSTISVISDVVGGGAAEHEFVGFTNKLDLDIHLAKKEFRINEDVKVRVTSSTDANYTLLTNYPFEQIDHKTFLIKPDTESESSDITVVASKHGYQTVSSSVGILVKNIFSVDVGAADSDGNRLSVPFEITINDDKVDAVSPYHAEIKPGYLRVVFPQTDTVNDAGYHLARVGHDGVIVNEDSDQIDIFLDKDIVIDAIYDRVVLVDIINGTGSGIYRYGDAVEVSAPDRDRVSFLIRDVFDHWEGGLESHHTSSKVTFVATHDIEVVAAYREDYTYLMLVVFVPLTVGGAYVISKNITGFKWTVQNVLEGTVMRIQLPKKKRRDKKTKSIE